MAAPLGRSPIQNEGVSSQSVQLQPSSSQAGNVKQTEAYVADARRVLKNETVPFHGTLARVAFFLAGLAVAGAVIAGLANPVGLGLAAAALIGIVIGLAIMKARDNNMKAAGLESDTGSKLLEGAAWFVGGVMVPLGIAVAVRSLGGKKDGIPQQAS